MSSRPHHPSSISCTMVTPATTVTDYAIAPILASILYRSSRFFSYAPPLRSFISAPS